MADIRDIAYTLFSATTANMVMEMPTHVTGDLLVACVAKDTAAAFTTPSTSVGTPVSSSNWTLIQASTSTGAAGGIYALRASSSSENVTFPLSIETCVGTVISVKNVFGTTVADAIPTSAIQATEDATLPFGGVGLTTAQANSLLIHMRYQDTTAGTSHLPPWVNLASIDVANGGLAVAYSFEPTASTAITAPNCWGATVDDGKGVMIEVRDGSSGAVKPPYIPLDVTPSVLISSLTGTSSDTGADIGTYVAAASIAITSVAGKTVTGVAMATTADSGYNPFRGSMRNIGVSSTTGLNHVELNRASVIDVTTGDLVFGTYLHSAPRDYVDTGKAIQGGKYIILASNTTNWRAWVVGGQFSKTDTPNARVNFLIEPSFTTTEYASAGTANYASLDYMAFGSSGYYGLPVILWNELWELRTAILAGGTTTNPFNFDRLVETVKSGCGNIPVIQQTGALGHIWIPLQFGGNENVGIACNLNTFQWPRQADEIDYVDFHVANNSLGVEFFGTGTSDLLRFTNCLFTSPSSYYWRFNASHSASANIDFSGSSVVNATVTLRSTVTLDNITFINCGTFTQNAATITNSAFSNTKVTSAAPGDADNISNTTFTSSGTGHAIEIGGTAASITLTGLTFTSYAATDGSTGNEAIYVNIVSGSMTISISGGTIPSVRTAGATVNKINAVTVKVTVKDANTLAVIENARVLMEAAAGGSLPVGVTVTISNSTTTATVTHTTHGLVTGNQVKIKGAGYSQNNGVFTITVTGASTYTYPITAGNDGAVPGTITSTAVILFGLTNASGILQTTSFNFTSSQPVTGRVRRTTAGTLTITATSGSGTVATLTFATQGSTPFPAGTIIKVTGLTPAGYNGVYVSTGGSTTTVTYASTTTGSMTVAGTVANQLYKTGSVTGTITSTGLDTTVLLIPDE